MNLLMMGPPGSGKGTQGSRLAERLGLVHIAAGDVLRAEVAQLSPIGRQAADLMHRGELVPDDLIIELLLPKVLEAAAGPGYLLDGFPRTVAQAEHAHEVASTSGDVPDAVIYLDVDRAELTRRIVARAEIEGRADDTEETVANRLRVFDEATHPLIEYYRERGLLHVIDAAHPEDEVTAAILSELNLAGLS